MTVSALITMVIVLGIVWGGFLIVLILAVSREKNKNTGKNRTRKR